MPAESLKKCQKRTDYFVSYEIAEPGVEVYNKFEMPIMLQTKRIM